MAAQLSHLIVKRQGFYSTSLRVGYRIGMSTSLMDTILSHIVVRAVVCVPIGLVNWLYS